jgi:hypothetical protein
MPRFCGSIRQSTATFSLRRCWTSLIRRAKTGARATLAYWRFAASELIGLLHGLPMEWFAKRTAGEEYLHSCSRSQRRRKLPTKEAEMERLLERLVRKMEFAIAHHDFPKARFYSAAGRKTRKKLERAQRNSSQA